MDPQQIPAHLLARSPGCEERRFRLVLWWLTYRLPIEADLDEAAVLAGCTHAKYPLESFHRNCGEYPIQFERVRWKRRLRLDFLRTHGWCPKGSTPGWPLGRNADQISVRLWRRKAHPSCLPRDPRPGALRQIHRLYSAATRIGDDRLRANLLTGLQKRIAVAVGLSPNQGKIRHLEKTLSARLDA